MTEIPAAESPYIATEGVNAATQRKQRLIWGVVISAVLVGGGWFTYDYLIDDKPKEKVSAEQAERISATASVARGAKTDSARDLTVQVSTLDSDNRRLEQEKAELATRLAQAEQQRISDHNNAVNTMKAYEDEVARRSQAPAQAPVQAAPLMQGPVGAPAAYSTAGDPFAPASAQQGAGMSGSRRGAAPRRTFAVIKTSAKAPTTSDADNQPAPGAPAAASSDQFVSQGVQYYESKRFVPPNAYAKARVLVGVDATTGVSQSADPKPVMFRITGPATHVGAGGRYQTTDLTGCVVNGAAYAELSSEKVYIKLQRISCPAGPKQFAVAAVEGYAASRGKAGVRGKVISREGGLTTKAFLAGTLQGLGTSLERYTNQSLNTITAGAGGSLQTPELNKEQMASGALGGGIGNAASVLADYYIKRAEQYQPVIEMPTGVEVELVFLKGFEVARK
ncbi:MAG: conjugal transfer protein TrbI [Asticcacaulis sp.]|nr:conjugal transfer protein TrbI [Asticcacaulis sp.]